MTWQVSKREIKHKFLFSHYTSLSHYIHIVPRYDCQHCILRCAKMHFTATPWFKTMLHLFFMCCRYEVRRAISDSTFLFQIHISSIEIVPPRRIRVSCSYVVFVAMCSVCDWEVKACKTIPVPHRQNLCCAKIWNEHYSMIIFWQNYFIICKVCTILIVFIPGIALVDSLYIQIPEYDGRPVYV